MYTVTEAKKLNERETMKTCSKCKIEKPFEDFAKREKSIDGYRGQCRKCQNAQIRSRKPKPKDVKCNHCGILFSPKNNSIKICSEECKKLRRKALDHKYNTSEERKAYIKEWNKTEKATAAREAYRSRPEVKASMRKAGRKFDKSHKGRWRAFATKIKSAGGYLNDTFESYLKHCDKKHCDVCKVEMTQDRKGGTMRCVDHCHTTGKIRGALCAKCNSAEGYLKSDVEIVRNLLNYLENANDGN